MIGQPPLCEDAKGKQPQQWPICITRQIENNIDDRLTIDPFEDQNADEENNG